MKNKWEYQAQTCASGRLFSALCVMGRKGKSVEEEGEKERQRVSELKRSKRDSEEATNQETLGGKFVGRGHWLAVEGKEIYEEIVVEISFIFSVLCL